MLRTIARHGRWCLVLGLVAGLMLPDLARMIRPALPGLIACLLFMAAFRIGPRAAVGGMGHLGRTFGLVLVLQGLAPLAALLALGWAGLSDHPAGFAMVLVLAAPSVTGSPNFAMLMGRDPAPAMRLLLIGTAMFPLSVLPVLYLAPVIGEPDQVLTGAVRLLVFIVVSVGLAFALRARRIPVLSAAQRDMLDGASAIVLALVVIGLMSAAGPALRTQPEVFAIWLLYACVLNFGLQIAGYILCRSAGFHDERAAVGIIAGNRNIALFLLALPAPVMEPLLIFIACYQVPMYLTPIVMKPLLR